MLCKSELLPKAYRNNPANTLIAMEYGEMLSIHWLTATTHIHVIDGKPSQSAELMRARVRSAGHKFRTLEENATRATVQIVLADDPDFPTTVTFTAEPDPDAAGSARDAGALDLWFEQWQKGQNGRDFKKVWVCPPDLPWKCDDETLAKADPPEWVLKQGGAQMKRNESWWKFRPAMLHARATSACVRAACSEVLMGVSWCLPIRAEALSRGGWVTHDKLTVGDEILAFDQDTDTCRWVPVQRIRTYEAAQTYRLEHRSWRAVATAEHRWAIKRLYDGKADVRTSLNLRRGRPTVIVTAPAEDQESSISTRDASIIGWLMTDGHIRQMPGNSCPQMSITQTKYVDEVRALVGDDAVERVHHEAGPVTIMGKDCQSRTCYRWMFRSEWIREFMERTGFRCKGDGLGIVSRLGAEQRRAMWDAMMLANGTWRENGSSFVTGHRSVLDAFQALAALLGERLGPECYYPESHGECWIVNISRHKVVLGDSITAAPHMVEPVWCPTTETGMWVTRLDGFVFITGNSPEELGAQVGEDGTIIDAESWEDAPKPPPETVDEETGEALRKRANALPKEGQATFRTFLNEREITGFPLNMRASKVKVVAAQLDLLEKLAKDATTPADDAPEPRVTEGVRIPPPPGVEDEDGIVEAELLPDEDGPIPAIVDLTHGWEFDDVLGMDAEAMVQLPDEVLRNACVAFRRPAADGLDHAQLIAAVVAARDAA